MWQVVFASLVVSASIAFCGSLDGFDFRAMVILSFSSSRRQVVRLGADGLLDLLSQASLSRVAIVYILISRDQI